MSRNVQQYYDMLGVMNLEQMHNFKKGKFMYRLVNQKIPSNFENMWLPNGPVNRYNLRSSNTGNIRELFARTNYGLKTIQTSGAKL